MANRATLLAALLSLQLKALAQVVPTPAPKALDEVRVLGLKSKNGLGNLGEVGGAIIYAGKKTEVLVLDSLDANTALNNPRQILGRIPGMNFSETEGAGFPANGIGLRGLNPVQSVEMNVRQNGYNITADLYGYPETYYLPAMEAVERVEVTRGAASLQFGPQFGGVVNYVMRQGAKDKPFELALRQTGGSFGLFNSFTSVGGQVGKLNYYAYGQYRRQEGWRPNSGLSQATAYAGLSYQATDKLKLCLEYSLLRNKIQMPGGLTDSLFNANPRQSTRARNWLQSPWNVLTLTADYRLSDRTLLTLKTAGNLSRRALVWRNEDGGAAAPDTVDRATGQFVPREVENETFRSLTNELRLRTDYRLLGLDNTLAVGVRYFAGYMHRQGGGPGSTAADLDLNLYGGGYEYDFAFRTQNVAPFAETVIRLSSRFSLTPGVRYEFINSKAQGYKEQDGTLLTTRESRNRSLLLVGAGAQFQATTGTAFYGNVSQAYRPIDYSALLPFGVTSKIDPNLKDSNGYNADLGYRGAVGEWLNFDVGAFYLRYNRRIGTLALVDPVTGSNYSLRTNVADSEHKGVESYLEISPLKLLAAPSRHRLSAFNSLAYVDARYVSGEFAGKRVEYAPKVIERVGLTYGYGQLSLTGQYSYTSSSFGEANNLAAPDNENPLQGLVPAYAVWDISGTYHCLQNLDLKAGVNNLTDARYFTRRTDEYPGPGIIPGLGRSFYCTLAAKF
ncbi:TonB-dependent receptor [Hymenobacter sp. BRD128]|uniref:TonB-dependent receptor family protein n=1 Tax=Hymenobacter sp. BRD128 TaxID=2675878 RepID=UPI001564DEB6|nr:TonB-dependent receptor [Hymenobacter sp. BRD128]QKG55687.1 TonB-dependent receptor [Hymenobacter sp. BRD128]